MATTTLVSTNSATAYTTSPHLLSSSDRDRQSLLSLVQGTEGIDWSQSHVGWDNSDTTGSVCDWEGVSCRVGLADVKDGESAHIVTGINLPNSGLSGTLPSQLGQLAHLQEINLRGNLIRGSIPNEIAMLSELKTLDLTECQLGGTLPQRWASKRLDKLLLGENGIGGEFFRDVTSPHLASVTEINLEQNQLQGTLSGVAIKMMTKLETLSLSQNNISGLLPGKEFGSLPTLKYLYLDSNHLVGSLSSSMAQHNNASLEELWLQDNAFSGTVPASFVRMDKLHDFFIDGNKFTGLPEEMCSPNINSDFFEDEVSTSGTSAAEKNYCDYIACPAGSISLEGMHPCTKCPGTATVARMKNPYLGSKGTSCGDWTQRDILRMFYEGASKNGPWVKEGNLTVKWTDDSQDMCEFTGVTCDGHGNVIKIELKNCSLSGTISESVGFLQFLEEMDVSDNELTGFLPSDLRWTDLTKLDISGNRIRGVVPPLLCLMEDLNGNGNGNVFHCDRIACPSGSFNSKGRYYAGEKEEKCMPCFDNTPFIGQTRCNQKRDPSSVFGQIMNGSEVVLKSAEGLGGATIFRIGIALTVLGSSIIIYCALRRIGQQRQKRMKYDEERIMLNHTADISRRKKLGRVMSKQPYRPENVNGDISSGGDSSSSGDSDDVDDEFSMQGDQLIETHYRDRYGFDDQFKDNAILPRSSREESVDDDSTNGHRSRSNFLRDSGSVSSSRSAPLQVTDFIRDQRDRSMSKKGPIKKVIKEHIPRAKEAIRTTVATVSNGVRDRASRNSRGSYDMLETEQYSTIDFGSNVDVEMAGDSLRTKTRQNDEFSDSDSTVSSENTGKKTAGPRQYSDLLDVPTFE
ncbi:hypothetical protein HJC23_007376 [Cyclotella cryptica]|uniref:Leucine-rich repeat-containing N-terminal plant-type domain-containing protein n=1 Tax=Cyclotella cryptica TaxID=29204 RepID=A0ABD3Q4U0_9STRA|eukprot:CCRYP_008694-RA/>CCRYP_008694-RA protein AED:0.07 eAED:0.07 QI:0/-1/0/1/-1/1/1/0/855